MHSRILPIYQRSRNGFTLIELIVVMSILGVLTVTGVATYRLLFVKTDLQQIAQEVATDISDTRLESIAARNQRAYGVHFGTSSYEIFYNTYSASNVLESHSLPANVTFSTVALPNPGNDEVLFDKLTGKTFNSGTIILSHNGEFYRIVINPYGIVSVST